MLLNLNELKTFDIEAKDGSIGKPGDFFFDDHNWAIRYVVVDTGWLFGRKVLLAPEAVESVDAEKKAIAVSLTKQEIEDGPGVGTDLPVSRQEEELLRAYHGWPSYWQAYADIGAGPLIPPLRPREPAGQGTAAAIEAAVRERADPNLRSAREVEGYHIEATDGEIGHVEDFIVDEKVWMICYMLIDTRNWLPGRKVLVAPGWAEGIDWGERLVRVRLERDAIRNSPPYDPKDRIGRDYERLIHEHYGHTPYWI